MIDTNQWSFLQQFQTLEFPMKKKIQPEKDQVQRKTRATMTISHLFMLETKNKYNKSFTILKSKFLQKNKKYPIMKNDANLSLLKLIL